MSWFISSLFQRFSAYKVTIQCGNRCLISLVDKQMAMADIWWINTTLAYSNCCVWISIRNIRNLSMHLLSGLLILSSKRTRSMQLNLKLKISCREAPIDNTTHNSFTKFCRKHWPLLLCISNIRKGENQTVPKENT